MIQDEVLVSLKLIIIIDCIIKGHKTVRKVAHCIYTCKLSDNTLKLNITENKTYVQVFTCCEEVMFSVYINIACLYLCSCM